MTSRVFQSRDVPFSLYEEVLEVLMRPRFRPLGQLVEGVLESAFEAEAHGDWSRWCSVLKRLPEGLSLGVRLDGPAVTVQGALDPDQRLALEEDLRGLHPWRKGPYDLFDVFIDTEWRSDLKWDRLLGANQPLQGRTV